MRALLVGAPLTCGPALALAAQARPLPPPTVDDDARPAVVEAPPTEAAEPAASVEEPAAPEAVEPVAAPAAEPDALPAVVPADPRREDTAPTLQDVQPVVIGLPPEPGSRRPRAPLATTTPLFFSVLPPSPTFTPEAGVGARARFGVHLRHGDAPPWLSLAADAAASVTLEQRYALSVDVTAPLAVPFSIGARVGYRETHTQPWCGLAGEACDEAAAREAADARGLTGAARADLLARYALLRMFEQHAEVIARVPVATGPVRLDALVAWREAYLFPGTWIDEDGDGQPDTFPYAGSAYAAEFPGGERGLLSILELGAALSTFDAPSELHDDDAFVVRGGMALEATVRGAAPFTGSRWTFAGGHITATGALPLSDALGLSLHGRVLLDGVLGDVPVRELLRAGGLTDDLTFGGADTGRGIRAGRLAGKWKAVEQTELRLQLWRDRVFDVPLQLSPALFVEAGIVMDDVDTARVRGALAVGGGVRLASSFGYVLRLDVGLSPEERFVPRLYLAVGLPF